MLDHSSVDLNRTQAEHLFRTSPCIRPDLKERVRHKKAGSTLDRTDELFRRPCSPSRRMSQ